MKFRRWLITLLLLIMPLSLEAFGSQLKVEWEHLGKFKLDREPLDIVLSVDGKLAYILTRGAVIIYSAEENRITERIPVSEDISNLWVSPRGNLIYLTSTDSKELSVIRLGFAVEIERGSSISIGRKHAPVTLVAFMDFQCPFCSEVFPILEHVVDQYPDDVNLVFKHFPLQDHMYAEKAALASLAAFKQGKFLEMAAGLFENHNKLDDNTIEQTAKQLGLDMDLFKKEMKSESVKRILAEDMETARRLMIDGVPAIFVNGKKVRNKFLSNLADMVNDELYKQPKENPDCKGIIVGNVTDKRGRPIASVAVVIASGSAPFPDISALTNEKGEYRFRNISEGTYEIAIHKDRYQKQKKTVMVECGEVSQLNFEIKGISQ